MSTWVAPIKPSQPFQQNNQPGNNKIVLRRIVANDVRMVTCLEMKVKNGAIYTWKTRPVFQFHFRDGGSLVVKLEFGLLAPATSVS